MTNDSLSHRISNSFMINFIKNRILISVSAHITVIIMVMSVYSISIFLLAGNYFDRHLINGVNSAIAYAEAEINHSLNMLDFIFSNSAENIRKMILQNESIGSISAYIIENTGKLLADNQAPGFVNFSVYLYSSGGIFLSGIDSGLSGDFLPNAQPWYEAAVAAGGETAVSHPYFSLISGKTVVAFSRQIMDVSENPLGVVCFEINIDGSFARDIKSFSSRSYKILLTENFVVLSHPISFFIGQYLFNAERYFSNLIKEIDNGENIFRHRAENFRREQSYVFFHNIKNGWYLCIVIPVREYNRDIINFILLSLLFGIIITTGLCVLMYHVDLARKKSDTRNQQKSNFLATVSHEIRTPLNAILGITEIQMLNKGQTQAVTDAFLNIKHSGNMLLRIINDILDLSKIDAGKFEILPEKYDVASLINDVVQLNYIRFDNKPVEFKVDVDENTPTALIGDELRIKQILNNLLSNAFKYTDRGTITFSTSAECVSRGGIVQVTLVFQITDTGQGMTKEQVDNLFDDYSRFNLEANRTTEGAGLGMTITRNLVNFMQGQISVKSAVDKGTTVVVRLPQKTDGIGVSRLIGKELAECFRQNPTGSFLKRQKHEIAYEYMPYGNVLIVDDVEINLFVAKGLLANYGMKIDLVTSGFEAINKIKAGNVYDIVFMDHMMPRMDGVEVTKLIREYGYTHPIIALTANALAGQAEMFQKNGFDDFISKPIDTRHLNTIVIKYIRNKQPADVLEKARQEQAEFDKKNALTENQQVKAQLAAIFARDAERAAAVLETILKNNFQEENDLQLFVINIHAMKSALANIGESELSATAGKLEQAGRDNEINVMLSEAGFFIENLRKVIEKYRPKEDESALLAEDSDEMLDYLREKLSVIKSACLVLGKKNIKAALNELNEKKWSQKTKAFLDKTGEYLLHSEFDKIIALVDEFESYQKPI